MKGKACFTIALFIIGHTLLFSQSIKKMRKIGEEMYEAHNYESAIEQLTKALDIIPTDKKTLELRAKSYEKSEQIIKAIEDYAKLFQNNPKDEEFAFKAASLSYAINEYKTAIKFSKDALDKNRKNNQIRGVLVDAYMKLADYEYARPEAIILLEDNKSEKNYYRLGVIDYYLGNYKSSEIFLRQALNLNSKNVNSMLSLAKTLDKMEKFRLAKAQCAEAIKLQPRNVEIYKIKSLINEHTLNFREAVDDMTRVVAIEAENSEAYARRAMLYLKINEKDKAIDDYKTVIKHNPKDFDSYMKIVDLFLENKDRTSALTYLKLVKERFSKDSNYTEKIHYVDQQIEKLNPDKLPPEITVASHKLDGNRIDFKKKEETIVFYIKDKSELKSVFVNGGNVFPVKVNDRYKVLYSVNSQVNSTVLMQVSDIYGNVTKNEFEINYEEVEKSFATNSGAFDFKPTADVDFNIPTSGYFDKYSFALIFGNEDYTTNQSGLNTEVNVEFAQNDAYVFKLYAERILGVPESNIMFYTNATSGMMSQAITKFILLMEKTGGKGTFYFYYAGHGLPHEETKEPYLIPSDMNGRSLKGAISLNDLYHKMKKVEAQKITFFIDACFSGGARKSPLLAARGVKIQPKAPNLKGPLFVFTASSEDQSALPYEEKKHGMFTYYLLKKLKETVGNITYKELAEYVKEQVDIESLMINDKEQTPFIGISPTIAKKWENWKFINK
jgi:tetratricopeptide (TPR) repeat protein